MYLTKPKRDRLLNPIELATITRTVPLLGIGLPMQIVHRGIAEHHLLDALEARVCHHPGGGPAFPPVRSLSELVRLPPADRRVQYMPRPSSRAVDTIPGMCLMLCPRVSLPYSSAPLIAQSHLPVAAGAYQAGMRPVAEPWGNLPPAAHKAEPETDAPWHGLDFFGHYFIYLGLAGPTRARVLNGTASAPSFEEMNAWMNEFFPGAATPVDVRRGKLLHWCEIEILIMALSGSFDSMTGQLRHLAEILPEPRTPAGLEGQADVRNMVWSEHLEQAIATPEMVRAFAAAQIGADPDTQRYTVLTGSRRVG